ncbi:MAG: hypothetical protein NWT12_14480 [Paracoccaceae bacterium]|nr:hypothetical protein [Paracoccaceae bacterium]MDP5367488.1 hypothetical protein [Paracoccaceae bacterium]
MKLTIVAVEEAKTRHADRIRQKRFQTTNTAERAGMTGRYDSIPLQPGSGSTQVSGRPRGQQTYTPQWACPLDTPMARKHQQMFCPKKPDSCHKMQTSPALCRNLSFTLATIIIPKSTKCGEDHC